MQKKLTVPTLLSLTAALLLLLPVSVTAQGSAQVPLPDTAVKSCDRAQLWVEQNIDQLPREYQQIIELPLLHRKAVYHTLKTSERLDLWKTQWERALQRTDLSEPQRAVLLEALQLTESDLASLDARGGWRYDRALSARDDFEKRASQVFDRAEMRRLFAQIGPVAAQKVWIVDEFAVGSSGNLARTAEACSCSSSSDYCPDGYGCGTDSDGCNTIPDECGTFWTYDCDGECGQPFQQ